MNFNTFAGGEYRLTTSSLVDFLIKCPLGTYTAIRTYEAARYFVNFEGHMKRMVTSWNTKNSSNVDSESSNSGYDALAAEEDHKKGVSIDKELLSSVILDIIGKLGKPVGECELRIGILLAYDLDSLDEDGILGGLYVYISELPCIDSSIGVEIMEGYRLRPHIKDSKWVRDRMVLTARLDAEGNEVVLSKDGNISEGISSNFFIITREGKLITAPTSGVIAGTAQNIIFGACKELGVEIEFRYAHLSEIETWAACFITSSTRNLLEANSIVDHTVEGSGKKYVLELGNTLFKKIREQFFEILARDRLRRIP